MGKYEGGVNQTYSDELCRNWALRGLRSWPT
jgi:hypothetical protein